MKLSQVMKTTSFLLALAITLGAASGALASDKKDSKQSKPTPAPKATQAQPQDTALTGSHIKRKVKAQRVVINNPDPVYILDRQTIQTSGAADLSQVLIRTGFRR